MPASIRKSYAISRDNLGRGQYFDFREPREIFNELREASRGGPADYYGIAYEKIDRNWVSSGRALPRIIRELRGCSKATVSSMPTARHGFR